jgi:hypothetical protein
MNTFLSLFKSEITSELLIDHNKDNQNMRIYVDIVFYKYPCSLLSLDILDVLHSHTLNVENTLKKIWVDSKEKAIEEFKFKDDLDMQQRLTTMIQ